jgi:hypothetical protein
MCRAVMLLFVWSSGLKIKSMSDRRLTPQICRRQDFLDAMGESLRLCVDPVHPSVCCPADVTWHQLMCIAAGRLFPSFA